MFRSSTASLSLALVIGLIGCRTQSDSSGGSADELSSSDLESAGQTGGEVTGPGIGNGSEGDPSNGGALGGNNGGNCDEDPQTIDDLDAETTLGFAPSEVIAFATGNKQAPLEWLEPMAFSRGGAVPALVTPESGTSEITMVITPTSDGVRYITSQASSSSATNGNLLAGPALLGGCSDRLEIDVQVTLNTAGGAFAESFQGTLHASTPYLATLSLPFELTELMGDLSVSVPELENVNLRQFSIETQLGPGDLFAGTIGGIVEQNDGQVASAGQLELATWGENPCEVYEIPVAIDANLGEFTPDDLLSTVNTEDALTMTWNDQSQTELSIEVTRLEDADGKSFGCLMPDNFPPTLLLPAMAHTTTTDGRIDSTLEVDLFGQLGDSGELSTVELIFNEYMVRDVPIAEFETQFGITGVDLTGYDSATISFTSTYDVAGSTDVTGALEVIGIQPPAPVEPPPESSSSGGSAPGSPGSSITVLDSATW